MTIDPMKAPPPPPTMNSPEVMAARAALLRQYGGAANIPKPVDPARKAAEDAVIAARAEAERRQAEVARLAAELERLKREHMEAEHAKDFVGRLERRTNYWMTTFRPRNHVPAFDGMTSEQVYAVSLYCARIVAADEGYDNFLP